MSGNEFQTNGPATEKSRQPNTLQLPSLFRQPDPVHSPPGSPHPARITSSQSPPSLSVLLSLLLRT